jgi:dTDP-4-amino-4,6-dideoxygalactose transaminase
MPVHQIGFPCDIGAILKLARQRRLKVVEDAACSIGAELSMDGGKSWEKVGRPHGDIACFSFHPRKVITTGDGGMITTDSGEYDEKLRLLRHHGMSVSDSARHGSNRVIFEDYLTTAYNYRMTDIQAAVGIEQLKKLPRILKALRGVAALYEKELGHVSWLMLPRETDIGRSSWQSYPVAVLKNAPRTRDALMQHLLDNGVSTRRGVMNSHQERPYGNSSFDLKNSEEARDSVFLLPIFYGLTGPDIKKIAELIKNA